MLEIDIPAGEVYLEEEECFVSTKAITLRLEHSLVSLSKWETRWQKPFLDPSIKKTPEETLDYIKCMTLNQNVDPRVYSMLTGSMIHQIDNYINSNLTATTFSNIRNGGPNRQIVTSELIYYWMFGYGISMECQKWHLSRLLTLIRIFDVKSNSGKKMSRSEIYSQNRALNEARRKAAKSKG